MSKSKTFTVGYRRKRTGQTNYKTRLKSLKSGKIRIVIRPLSKSIIIQAVEYQEKGDKILSTLNSTELKKLGWKYNTGNTSSAYLAGLYFGIKNKNSIKDAIVDIGLKSITKGDRISAAIKGLADSGLNIPYSDSIFPDEKRINGTITSEFAKKVASDKNKYGNQFIKYFKENVEDIPKEFEKIKQKIISGKK